jgi:hypothetical protein
MIYDTEEPSPAPHQFVDSFRVFHPDRENAFTCWNTRMNCRSTNFGTRIDYAFVSRSLREMMLLLESDIHPNVTGSDHCPVHVKLRMRCSPSPKCPSICSSFFPEFAGRQLKITQFLLKAKKCSPSVVSNNDRGQPEAKRLNAAAARKTQQKKNISSFFKNRKVDSVLAWRTLMTGPPSAPNCTGHGEAANLRHVKGKKDVNYGRRFWVCPRGSGRNDDRNASCGFKKWFKGSNK